MPTTLLLRRFISSLAEKQSYSLLNLITISSTLVFNTVSKYHYSHPRLHGALLVEVMQDAGLIFMARMTTDVAERVMLRGGGADEVVATAVATTAIATASLGVVLVVAGKVKLTKFVAYLPMPVVSLNSAIYCYTAVIYCALLMA